MTPALRTYHKWFWITAAIALPVLFAAAVVVIPGPVFQPETGVAGQQTSEGVLAQGEHPRCTVRLRSDTQDAQRQIALLLNQPFNSAEALVYLIPDPAGDIPDRLFLGKLSSAGDYRFEVPSHISAGSIHVYDPFSGSVLADVALKPKQ